MFQKGATLDDIISMGRSQFTLSIGFGAKEAGEILYEKFDIPNYNFASLLNIEEVDELFKLLSTKSGKEIPRKFVKQRKQ
ncbi:MAG: hypothetical protein N2Z80_00190 [Hydrogenothermaceae bacterium]|nr:hypothetical protein [Hydrogenothermaceae bacterium]